MGFAIDALRLPHGYADYLLVFELLGAAVVLLLYLCRRILQRGGVSCLWRSRRELSLFYLTVLIWLLFYSQWCSEGRPVLAVGVALPGSLVTRSITGIDVLWLRRALEPSLWMLYLCCYVAAGDAGSMGARRGYAAAPRFLGLAHALECLALAAPSLQQEASAVRSLSLAAHFAFGQLGLLALLLAAVLDAAAPDRPAAGLGAAFRAAVPQLCGFVVVAVAATALERLSPRPELVVGAHYYSWFPENWAGGYIGDKLVPQVEPALGRYRSGDPEVFDQHVKDARSAGINLFVFDWWPKRREIRSRLQAHLAREGSLGDMRFALMYESLDLKEPGEAAPPGEDPNIVYMTSARAERLKKHWEHIAKNYLRHPSYLRINGRPVLFIYISRHLVGPVSRAIQFAREHVQQVTGENLFLIGDEAFFNVVSYSQASGFSLLPEYVPEWDRLAVFDGITSYNPYDSGRAAPDSVADPEGFLADMQELYRRYSGIAAAAGIPFMPAALPGYNDRGIRLKEAHYIVPRYFDGLSFFTRSLREAALPVLDSAVPMLLITSWNEWNEGTQIEPARHSPPTSSDRSDTGTAYSLGVVYEGYGRKHLEELAAVLSGEPDPAVTDAAASLPK